MEKGPQPTDRTEGDDQLAMSAVRVERGWSPPMNWCLPLLPADSILGPDRRPKSENHFLVLQSHGHKRTGQLLLL